MLTMSNASERRFCSLDTRSSLMVDLHVRNQWTWHRDIGSDVVVEVGFILASILGPERDWRVLIVISKLWESL